MDDLSGLDGLANAADAERAALNPETQPGTSVVVVDAEGGAQVVDYLREAGFMVESFAALAGGLAPSTMAVWDEKAKTKTAEALAPVLQKYGVSMGGMGCELKLLIIAGPLLWQTARLTAFELAAKKREAQAERTVDSTHTREVVPQPGQEGAPDPAGQGPGVHPQMALYRK